MSEVNKRPKIQATGNEGKIVVNTQVRRSGYNFGEQYSEPERETTEKITVPIFETAPAYVRVSASTTRNMGDFNSVKVSVDVSLPCYPEGSEIDRAYDICSAWVNQKIQDELEYAVGRQEQPIETS